MRVKVIFYSMYGHTYRLAEAIAEGADEVQGSEVELLQVPELVPAEILEKSGSQKGKRSFFSHSFCQAGRYGKCGCNYFWHTNPLR